MSTVRTLARQERSEFADLLASLAPQQWGMASLCSGWTVRDVVAHTVAYLDQLVGLMRRGVDPSGAGALYGGRVALIECLIHQQDVRRPLGRLRAIPRDRLRVSLSYARISPVIGGARRTHGVRLEATDIDWSAGSGPAVCGAGEALLLAMTGRHSTVIGELKGPGVRLLG